MTVAESKQTRPFTINDINVGSRLYEALVRQAKAAPGEPVLYGDLLARAREMVPHDAEMQRAVPIGIGMKLLFVQAFCGKNSYPNLACLAVNGSGSPGPGYKGNWEQDMRDVANFDWSVAQPKLDVFVSESTALVKRPRRITEAAAREVLYEHFRAHRDQYKDFSESDREEMINLLMEGIDLVAAYRDVTDAKAAQAVQA